MFPPVEASVLENNPDFASLYSSLTKSVLNADGTTRADPAAKARAAVREDLRAHRLKTAKRHLISSTIQRQPPSLPDPVVDLLFLLPPLLSHPPDATLLASPPLSLLPTLLPPLADLVSSSLRTSALALARVASPNTNASYLHRTIPALPQNLSTLLDSTQGLARGKIPAARLAATCALVPLLDDHARALARLVYALEAKLGSPQRDLLLRAEMLPLAAEEASLRASLNLDGLEKDIYAPEVRAAMEGYSRHLRDARARVEEKVRELGAALGAYGVGGEGDGRERVFREMGRVCGEMRGQRREVEGDLERLKR